MLHQSLVNVRARLDTGAGEVLIHCRNGANRSAIWCVAYMMTDTGCNMQDAYAHLRRCRKIVNLERIIPRRTTFDKPQYPWMFYSDCLT